MKPATRIQASVLAAYRRHRATWENCTRCPLHGHRTNVVLCRGSLPASVVFLGEGPGESEDVLGRPFVGPAGKLLDDLIQDAFRQVPEIAPVRFAVSNVVGCIPLEEGELSSGEIRPPNKTEAVACRPRLVEFFRLAAPRLIVTLGQTAKKYLPETKAAVLSLVHPSAILRMDEHRQGLACKRFYLDLAAAMRKAVNHA